MDRLRGERGATAVEYAIMASAIAAVVIGVVALVGSEVNQLFTDFVGQL